MKSFVIDASVVIKWIFPNRDEEEHIPQALHLLRAIKQDSIKILQPPHWLAEAAAVIVRLEPKIAEEAINVLTNMDFSILDIPEIYQIACELSARFKHHLFDTLYHAVAMYSHNTQFITADDIYYKKTAKQGSIIRLADFHALELS
ncbi:MAG: type II toxin-antitoxin system VapC family toxin [Gammaproteobacteria bacterium]|nr:type II toxin-antitoxin system VapC family toxin [Gammaproteobacteria bacterium]